MTLQRSFRLRILEKPMPFPRIYCVCGGGGGEQVGEVGVGGAVQPVGLRCLSSTPRPLGVSADPPAQIALPKPPQASQEDRSLG